VQRKLTVIFSADVVGYSGLMERDEAGTLERLKANRKSVFDPCIATHGGRIVKLMGDGTLVEFASVVSSVICAQEIQHASEAVPYPRESERIRYRIGIHLCEVIVDGDDIYGDGVNVAARLQGLAEPGGIALSRTVRDQVAGKAPAEFVDLGEHSVKNIGRPIHVFSVRAASMQEPSAPTAAARPSALRRVSLSTFRCRYRGHRLDQCGRRCARARIRLRCPGLARQAGDRGRRDYVSTEGRDEGRGASHCGTPFADRVRLGPAAQAPRESQTMRAGIAGSAHDHPGPIELHTIGVGGPEIHR